MATDQERSIVYNCRRTGRLCRENAIGMLMYYTSTLGRPAFDRTFGDAEQVVN